MLPLRGTALSRSPAHKAAEHLSFSANVSNTQIFRAPQPTQEPRRETEAEGRPFVIENRVRIRFTRMGRKKLPFYRIVAIDSRKRRDGRPIEWLGWYNPMTKEKSLKTEEISKWLKVGAEPSDTVASLLRKAGVLPPRWHGDVARAGEKEEDEAPDGEEEAEDGDEAEQEEEED